MLKLISLAGINCILALILSSSFLTNVSTSQKMTQDHVARFIREMNDISNGARADMDNYNITRYFMKHVADNSEFTDTVKYDMPQVQVPERTMKMSKLDFISHVLKELGASSAHASELDIENIQISPGGHEATAVIVNRANGVLPVQDVTGNATMVPVVGTSFCEQKLVLKKGAIQVQGANCTTNLAFADP